MDIRREEKKATGMKYTGGGKSLNIIEDIKLENGGEKVVRSTER